MQCEICQKSEATIHLTEITEGVRVEAHLCQKCAIEQGVAMKGQVPINELLSSLLSVQPTDEELSGISGKELVCSKCGKTWRVRSAPRAPANGHRPSAAQAAADTPRNLHCAASQRMSGHFASTIGHGLS